jgi:uncharacterized protein YdaU (DUF1376 family)
LDKGVLARGGAGMKFYKRDPDAALAGMAELTLEECGAYNKIIDLLYSRDGLLPDDDTVLRRLLGCHGNQLRSVKAALLRKGKIWIEDGLLKANRVDSVLKEAGNFSETQRKRAGKRWEKSGKRPTNNEITEQNQTAGDAKGKMPYTPIATPIATVVPAESFQEKIVKVNRLGQALGFDPTTARNGHRFIEDLVRLEADGFDFELDILATIQERRTQGSVPRDLSSLAYFRKAFEAKREGRKISAALAEARANAPVEQTDAAGWDKRLKSWLEGGYWPSKYGPRPRSGKCLAPADRVALALKLWEEQGGHPKGAFPADPNGRFQDWKDLRNLRDDPDSDYGNAALNVVAIPRRA